MNEDTVMPDWLHDIFLGYGDPAQAKYTHMPADQLLQTIDFKVQQQACIWPKVLQPVVSFPHSFHLTLVAHTYQAAGLLWFSTVSLAVCQAV